MENNLTLEQQFNLRSFESQVDRMSLDQAKEFLVKLYAQMMMKDNAYKNLLKADLGVDHHATEKL